LILKIKTEKIDTFQREWMGTKEMWKVIIIVDKKT